LKRCGDALKAGHIDEAIRINGGCVPALPLPAPVEQIKAQSWLTAKEEKVADNVPVYIFGANHMDAACAYRFAKLADEIKPAVICVEQCASLKNMYLHVNKQLELLGILQGLDKAPLTSSQMMEWRLANLDAYSAAAYEMDKVNYTNGSWWLRAGGFVPGIEINMGIWKAKRLGAKFVLMDLTESIADDLTYFALRWKKRNSNPEEEKRQFVEHVKKAQLTEPETATLNYAVEQALDHYEAAQEQLEILGQRLEQGGNAVPHMHKGHLEELKKYYNHQLNPTVLLEYLLPQESRIALTRTPQSRDAMTPRDVHMAKAIIEEQRLLLEAGKPPGPILVGVGMAHDIGYQLRRLGPQLLPEVYGEPKAAAQGRQHHPRPLDRAAQEAEKAATKLAAAAAAKARREAEAAKSRERLQKAWAKGLGGGQPKGGKM